MPGVKKLPESKDSDILDEGKPEGGESNAEQTVKALGQSMNDLPLIYRKEQCLGWAAQIHQGTMAANQTVIQSAQAFYDWLTSD